MMDLSQQEQFDLDRLADDLGALPEAPLAMPLQRIETPVAGGLLTVLLRLRLRPVPKAGH